MENFTPISGFIGGCIIGFAALLLMVIVRQLCGISGIFGAVIPPVEPNSSWRLAFICGLITGGFIIGYGYVPAFDYVLYNSIPYVALAGFLVGLGSRLGRGCTSGHGVCGIGRLSSRSIYATILYLTAGIATATLIGYFK